MTLFFIVDPSYVKGIKTKIDYWGLSFLALGLGCLQVVLDKGQREDWFSSTFITRLSVIAAVSLILFIIVELYIKNPIVNFKVFRNISFTTGIIVMFATFFNLFGSILLLPIYVQTLMGYTATLAGLVLGPGGIVTLIAMPVAGRLINKVNSKGILAFGIITSAYSTHLMAQFNLSADFTSILWPRIVLGLGMGFLFIPLTTITLSSIPKEDMGNATGIYNLLRNLGGSFGVATVTTMLARRAQFHQLRLVEHLTPFDRAYQWSAHQAGQGLQYRGFDSVTANQGGLSLIYGRLIREASMLSFNDAFRFLSILMILVLPLVLLMRSRKEAAPVTGAH
jgi:DHA2 family multidrug resistance protein